VEAVKSALNQIVVEDYEIIIVDNQSQETVPIEILGLSYHPNYSKIKYYSNIENIGMVANWNRGINLSRGKWLTILHDDDILHPCFLYYMCKVVNKYDKIDLLVSKVRVGEIVPEQFYKIAKGFQFAQLQNIDVYRLILGNISPAPGIFFRKNCAEAINLFDVNMYPCSDYHFWIEYCRKYNAFYFNKELAFYRTSDSETLKGNTLFEMFRISTSLKKKLLDSSEGMYPLKKLIYRRVAFEWQQRLFIVRPDLYENVENLTDRIVLPEKYIFSFVIRVMQLLRIYRVFIIC
jgi:glycosyltransferase involved in cell wall biosynthesis